MNIEPRGRDRHGPPPIPPTRPRAMDKSTDALQEPSNHNAQEPQPLPNPRDGHTLQAPAATTPPDTGNCPNGAFIREGDWVVLEATDAKRVLGHVVRKATARLGKRKRTIDALIGAQFGDVFAVLDNHLKRVEDIPFTTPVAHENAMLTDKDNHDLHDRDDNQILSHSQIQAMKAEGITGHNLVSAVVQNSATFEGKTPFSQDKYLKRKLQKHDLRVRVVQPTALSICETYFAKSPEKTLHMRPDALALVLGYSGVRAGCRAMVYETCTGLVSAAMAERMGGFGQLFNVFTGTSPPGSEILRMMNAPEHVVRSVLQTPLELFGKLDVCEPIDADWIRYNAYGTKHDEQNEQKVEYETSERRLAALAERPKRADMKRMLKEQCDVLVVASRFDPIPVVDVLLPHVAPSGTFAVYGMYLQPLAELQYALQLCKMATRVEILEADFVSHQVLPGRTHPFMSDSATGGYVLWGIRVAVWHD